MSVLPKHAEFLNLIPGYLGVRVDGLSVNSAFFAEFYSDRSAWESMLVFPQRIPRTDFFEELLSGQPAEVRSLWKDRLQTLIEARNQLVDKNTAQSTQWDLAMEAPLINLERALLRLGALEVLVKAAPVEGMSADGRLELALVRATAELSAELSQGLVPSLRGLKACVDLCSENTGHDIRVAIITLAVASAFRYFREGEWLRLASEWTTQLLEHLESTAPDSFRRLILHSMAYRAAAMDGSRGKEFQQQALDRALQFAEAAVSPEMESLAMELPAPIQTLGTLERLAARDNLFTLCQTLSKWYGRKEPAVALQYYDRMVALDPFDSVAYSERGLFEFNRGEFQSACSDFEKAAILGPPGIGMNLYFLGKTQSKLGNLPVAITTLQLSEKADPMAVSASLELVEIYKQLGDATNASRVARRILDDTGLSDQLEDTELQGLRLAVIS
jgi:tetratricopeptide (TPR) repeat protein